MLSSRCPFLLPSKRYNRQIFSPHACVFHLKSYICISFVGFTLQI
nr:MAG TPA: hypothetical protein [Caudoviricetes sp.]DAZ32143.1 MAG TPA: hypothetical protein [Caudoviricetes sp.]